MAKKQPKPELKKCPECDSTELLVYEETAFDLNTGEYYCNTVKSHDSYARVRCKDCQWEGVRRDLSQ